MDNPVLTAEYFRVRIEETSNQRSAASQRQALASYLRFREGGELTERDFDEVVLADWVARLLAEGYSMKTVAYYLKNLSGLYSKAVADGLVRPSDAFSLVASRLRDCADSSHDEVDTGLFGRLRKLVASDPATESDRQLAVDLVLFSIYMGGLTFEELAAYRKPEVISGCEAIDSIVSRYSRPRNKYLFPLRQSERTPRQMTEHLKMLFTLALGRVGVKLSSIPSETARTLWGFVALHCGIAPSVVAGCMGRVPHGNPVFSFVIPADVTPEARREVMDRVISALVANPSQWYAMQFRPHVSFDDVIERARRCGVEKLLETRFYPMEEIARRVGHKLVFENKPVVPGLLFFRCKVSDLTPLFRHIGDLAWGYRQSRAAASPYAVISNVELMRYQRAIGSFTSETELYPVGAIKLQRGDKLEVIGGMFDGQVAWFDSQVSPESDENSGATVYRLIMVGDNGFEWRVESDARLVRRISEERYNQLANV
ncbi:MAG: hypothetical protein NC212_01585 [Staphylococcus sp.]|nr:hypothetical protein [Staphylococcus sp.]